jgi:hypothetical protein
LDGKEHVVGGGSNLASQASQLPVSSILVVDTSRRRY